MPETTPPMPENSPVEIEPDAHEVMPLANETAEPQGSVEYGDAPGMRPAGDGGMLADEMLRRLVKAERQAANLRRGITVAAVAAGALLIPFAYLKLSGNFSSRNLRLLAQPTPTPKPEGKRDPNLPGQQMGIANPTSQREYGATPIDPVAQDLATYVGVLLPTLTPDEQKAIEVYQTTTGTAYKSDAASARIIHDQVIPLYKAYLAKALTIRPQTDPVRGLHEAFLDIGRNKLQVFIAMSKGGDSKNTTWRKEAAARLKAVQASQSHYQQMGRELINRYKVGIHSGDDF